MHVPFKVILFFSVLVTRKRRHRGVKYLDLEQHDGAEIHTEGRVALMLCCPAIGGEGRCGYTFVDLQTQSRDTAPPPTPALGCFLGGKHEDSKVLQWFLRTVSLIEHPPWFPKFNQAWNSFLLLKNPMSFFFFFGHAVQHVGS